MPDKFTAVGYSEYNIRTQKEEFVIVCSYKGVEYRIYLDENDFKPEPASENE